MRYLALILSLLITLGVPANENELLKVYKSQTCGCCKHWLTHLGESDVKYQSTDVQNLAEIKAMLKIKPQYQSCHTAISKENFIFEGHVPAKFIRQFLAEKPEGSIGLSVPAMPLGSPGMEVGDRFTPYKVLLLMKDGSAKEYAQINKYEEQF